MGLLVLCACDDSASLVVAPDDQPGGDQRVHVRFDLASPSAMRLGAIPWPDDLYLDKQARVTASAFPSEFEDSDYGRSLSEALTDLDGFGVSSPIYFYLDGDIAPNSLPQSAEESTGERASVFLIDADTGSSSAFQRVRAELQWLPELRRLALRPALGHPLTPGRRYAAIVTRRVKDVNGQPLEPASGFATLRDPDITLADTRWAQARAEYTPVLETLDASGIARTDVVAMAVFRVQVTSKDLEAARRIVRAGKPPIPSHLRAVIGKSKLDAVFSSAPASEQRVLVHDQLAAIVHGTLPSPNFLSASPSTHGVWERDGSGQLIVKRMDDVPFTLFLPANNTLVPASAPIVIYQHQRGRERSDAIAIANKLAARHIAVLAIDAPFQGMRARATDPARGVDWQNRFTGEDVADGFGDEPGDFFGADDTQGDLPPLHPFYARDAMRQGVVDLMTAVRFVEEGDFSLITSLDPSLDGTQFAVARLGFLGEDLGAQLGVALAPYEPNLQALALFAAGAGLAQEWWLSPADQALFERLIRRFGRDPANVDYEADPPSFWPELALFDTLTSRAEPLAYAAALRRSQVNTLLLMARDDEVVSNLVTEALAVGIGATSVSGVARYVGDLNSQPSSTGQIVVGNFAIGDDRATRILQTFDGADHALLLNRRGIQNYSHPPDPPFEKLSARDFLNPTDAAQKQVVDYFDAFFRCVAKAGTSVSAIKCPAPVTVYNGPGPD